MCRHVMRSRVTCCKYSITCQDDLLTVDNAQSHVTAFRPISEAARSWSDDKSLLQICHWVPQQKNFINRLTFGKVRGKHCVLFFWLTVYKSKVSVLLLHLTMYSVLWASHACSIFINSSSIRSTIVRMHPRMLYGGPCNTPTNCSTSWMANFSDSGTVKFLSTFEICFWIGMLLNMTLYKKGMKNSKTNTYTPTVHKPNDLVKGSKIQAKMLNLNQ